MKKVFWSLLASIITVIMYAAIKFIIPSGSYAYAEEYEFKTNEHYLVQTIERLKKENNQYVVPIKNLCDGRTDSNDYWYHVYFYLPEENKIFYFWTRPSNKDNTDLGLVGVNGGLQLGHWKNINEDFTDAENEAIKKKFEQKVLDKLGLKYKDKGNGMSIFGIQF